MDGLHEHPMNNVVGKTWAINVALLPVYGLHRQMTHLPRLPAIVQIVDTLLSISLHFRRIQLALVLWIIVNQAQLSTYDIIRALVLRTIVNSEFRIFQ